MQLVLGTVQFGLRYGIAGRGTPVPEGEVREILARAHAQGIRTLDTAAAYGDIEERLPHLAGGKPFDIVTKVPPLPTGLSTHAARAWIDQALAQAKRRLGRSPYAVMFHRADDLLESAGSALWERCEAFAENEGIKVGVSCYDPAMVERVRGNFPITIVQMPANALDQRISSLKHRRGTLEIHVRSAFLQGLLLLPMHQAVQRVPKAAAALERWHAWLDKQDLAPLDGALALVKGLPQATHCVVGVDDLRQFDDIVRAWRHVPALQAEELASIDLDTIDPRLWPARS